MKIDLDVVRVARNALTPMSGWLVAFASHGISSLHRLMPVG